MRLTLAKVVAQTHKTGNVYAESTIDNRPRSDIRILRKLMLQ